MIKEGLKPHSQSNGRELEYTILSLQNKEIESEFAKIITKIIDTKRLYPRSRNGLKRFNVLFETYIKKIYKEYKTVNVYARNLNSENFLDFWDKLKRFVSANPHIFQGRIEPHPADKEINSWHIQYTGANAIYIEKVLAAFIVKQGIEISMEMALGTDIKPYFETTEEPIYVSRVSDELFVQNLINQSKKLDPKDDLLQAQEKIERLKQQVPIAPLPPISSTSTQALRQRLEQLRSGLSFTPNRAVDDIRNRHSNRARDVINRIKRERNL